MSRQVASRTVRVDLEQRAYDVIVGHEIRAEIGPRIREIVGPDRRILLVIDDALPNSISEPALDSLARAGFHVTTARAKADEEHKSLEQTGNLLIAAANARLGRDDLVVALGGGVVGDVAGFVAATYRRGIGVIQCPTTLLSMVDASVGGKTGVNLTLEDGSTLKNAVGAFHQPRLVLADTQTLSTLSERNLRCGLAECIKHTLLCADEGLLERTEDNIDGLLSLEPEITVDLVARNVAVKARVVAADEREHDPTGGRALLNLGHTFAHAIETLPHLSPDAHRENAPLRHGEAVALGVLAACRCALELGTCSQDLVDRVTRMVSRAGLPVQIAGMPGDDALIDRMQHDKKTLGGKLRIVVPETGSRCRLMTNPDPKVLQIAWASIRA
jgi:3-dehydroquinate synthase